jgi:hypothetical protein
MDASTTIILSVFISVVGVAIYEVVRSYYERRHQK